MVEPLENPWPHHTLQPKHSAEAPSPHEEEDETFIIHSNAESCHLQASSWVPNPKPYPAKYLPAQAELEQVLNLSSQATFTDMISQ